MRRSGATQRAVNYAPAIFDPRGGRGHRGRGPAALMGYGNDSGQTGPLAVNPLRHDGEDGFALYVEMRTRRSGCWVALGPRYPSQGRYFPGVSLMFGRVSGSDRQRTEFGVAARLRTTH